MKLLSQRLLQLINRQLKDTDYSKCAKEIRVMEAGEYQERSLSRGVWGRDLNDEGKCRAKEQRPCHRNEAGVWDGAQPARLQGREPGETDEPQRETGPGHGRPRPGSRPSSKRKGRRLEGWNKPGEGRDLTHAKGPLRLPCKAPTEAGSSVRRCPAKLRQNKPKTETDEHGLDFEARALSLAETGWCVNRQREKEKKKTKNASQSRESRTKLRAGPCRFRAPGASEEAQALAFRKGPRVRHKSLQGAAVRTSRTGLRSDSFLAFNLGPVTSF